MRKAIAAALIIISMSAISAKPELWIDASFVADRNMVSEEIGASFPAMAKEVDVIRSLGIDLSLAFFPSDVARVGFVGGYSFLMPIGFSEPGGSNIGYVTYDLDCRQDLSIGLAYYQFFNETIGAFLISSFEWSWYRTAIEHIPNDSAPMDYVKAHEYGVHAELGIVSRSDDMFFRLGATGFYDISHQSSSSLRFGITAGGGIII